MKPKTIILYFFLTTALASGAFISVPDTPNGNAFAGVPFAVGVGGTARFQQVYSASAFSSIPRGGLITAIAFRPDCMPGQICIGNYVPDAQIDFSTTAKAVDGLSTFFAENVGSDERVAVPRGVVPFTSMQDPNSFKILQVIQLSDPFFYNPAQGNLLMDVRVWQGDINIGFFDAESTLGDAVSGVAFSGGAGAVDAPSGSAFTTGLVTAFVVTPVPEPSVIWILGGGFVGILSSRAMRRQRAGRQSR